MQACSNVVQLFPDRTAPAAATDNLLRRRRNADYRSREYLTEQEVALLMEAAKRIGRHGHRDKTLILLSYRHGLRVTELVSLRWDQINLDQGLIHVNRLKRGNPSVHPLRETEIQALRQLRDGYPLIPHVFSSERKAGEIEQPPQKETWIQDTQSGILQLRRCTSYLNPRMSDLASALVMYLLRLTRSRFNTPKKLSAAALS